MRSLASRSRHCALAALLCAAASAVQADTETVTLGGKTYAVETKDGYPVSASSADVEIGYLGATSSIAPDKQGGWTWLLQGRVKRPGSFKATITTPLDETASAVFDVVGGRPMAEQFFDSEAHPKLWAWLEEDATSWFPFVLAFEDSQSGDRFEVTQWNRFAPADKARFRELASSLSQPLPVGASADKAAVYVFRESNVMLQGRSDIFADQAPIASLPRRSYVAFQLDPGSHLLWGDCPAEWFELEVGRTYLLRNEQGANGEPCLAWSVGEESDIRIGISFAMLERVVPTEESLTELRGKLGRYERARKKAGEPPAAGPFTIENVVLADAAPAGPFAAMGFGKKRTGTLAIDETVLSYRSAEKELDVALADVRSTAVEFGTLIVNYQRDGKMLNAPLGGLSAAARNRVLLAIQNSRAP